MAATSVPTVTAAAVVVQVEGQDRYLYKGAVLPDGVKAEDVKRLKSIGLVKDVKVQTAPQATADADDAEAKAAAEKAAAEKAAAEKAAAEKAAADKAAADKASTAKK
ncbi:hypothetical protein [Brevibacterium sp.]|uniref:hypothetical protein n=1 Tax=Brevibacterium sp. TaxID=1701 RepID=UPI002811A94C|nr:hypothetical protein [Brevibacterium sp.]